jgi:uncharacterized protein (TIGR03437 family)
VQHTKIVGIIIVAGLAAGARAQLSSSAYRALGQPDLHENGLNIVQGSGMYSPFSVALDARDGGLHLYVADTRNNRVLAWQDAPSSQMGDPATLVLGQPNSQLSGAFGIGAKGFNSPGGLAVDPTNGNLYVADFGNNRVLRFPAPFANPSRIEPDAVYGQADLNSRNANPFGVTNNSMSQPRGLAFDAAGNLWVADSGNHRVLEFNAASLNAPNPSASLVLGQKDFSSGLPDRGSGAVSASGFDTPFGLAFDAQGNLYVSDFLNTRVLKFAAPIGMDQAAAAVFGELNFTTRLVPPQASASTLAGPQGLTVDSSGNLYVAVPNDNRILMFLTSSPSGSPAKDVWGQVSFTSTSPNPASFPYASAATFAGVEDVKADAAGNLFVVDAGNNRVLFFAHNSKSATQVWGQGDFSSNGPNQIKPGSINLPFKIVIDYSQSPFALYVSDTNNNRVLGWKDAARFHTGDPADLVIGQPNLSTGLANVDSGSLQKPSVTSLWGPRGLALDAAGNLYVADSGNNRVLRFPRPVDQSGRITADLVIGQADFVSSISAAVTASSLNSPAGLAIGPDGDLFVADAGNNRVLEFANGAVTGAAAIRVYGQPSFNTGALPSSVSAQTLAAPQGITVDSSFTLYVADTSASRILIFADTAAAPSTGASALAVIGQAQFNTFGTGAGPTGLHAPTDVATDSNGTIYIADSGNNRVLGFPSLLFLPLTGAGAASVLGQKDMTGVNPDWNTTDGLATPEGLFSPIGLWVDQRDTLYVGDAGNNRVVHFLKPASVANAANPTAGTTLAQGGLATISGAGFSDSDEQASGMPLPLVLANREVALNDAATVPLSSVTSAEVDLQIPSSAPLGTVRVAVRVSDTGELIAGGTVSIAALSPALYSNSGDGTGQGKITNQDGTANSAANPAARGTVIKIFGTGQGPVSPPVADGSPAPADPPADTVAVPTSDGKTCLSQQPSVCVAIGSVFGDIQFSGLAPGMVGMWELDVKIPTTAPTGAVNVRAVINGVLSNLVSVAIK